jgi:hypothetical protein
MGIPMEIRDTTRVQMAQTLMPEETKLIAGKVADKILGIVGSEQQLGERRGRRG